MNAERLTANCFVTILGLLRLSEYWAGKLWMAKRN
jgi:hypothetical protein